MRFISYFSLLCKESILKPISLNRQKYNFYSLWSQNISKKVKFPLSTESFAKLHLSCGLYAKSFQEKENEYAHSVLENLPAYRRSIVTQPLLNNSLDSLTFSSRELQEFAKVTKQCASQNINLEDWSLTNLVTRLVKKFSTLSDEELVCCFHLLCLWPPTAKTYTPNFKAFWNHLDYECVKRLFAWDSQHQLLIADYWFHLRLSRITNYNRDMIRHLVENLNKLTDPEFVQLMFYINLQREIPNEFVRSLENRWLSLVDTISLDESCVVCLAFFKTQNKINDFSIIKTLMDRFMSNVETLEQVTNVAMLKFFKKSFNFHYTDTYVPLLHKCVKYVDSWDPTTCVHLALFASECHVYHPLLLDAVTERITKTIEVARFKDCTKLLQCLAHFNHFPSTEFNQSLFAEYEKPSRQDEIAKYPRDLIYAALYYAYMGHYNYDLLNIVLNPDFRENCTKLFPESSVAFIEVDCCIEIECKDYKGYRLKKRDWSMLGNRRKPMPILNKPNTQTRLTNEVMQSLESILPNKESYRLTKALPHLSLPDIVVQLSGNSQSLSSSEDLILKPPPDELWACIVLGVPFSFAHRSKHLTGVTAMKLRQLEKLGYQILFLPYFELPRDTVIRTKFLKQKLEAIAENNQINEHQFEIK